MNESWRPAVVLIVPHWTAAPIGSRWTDGLSGTTSETTGTTSETTGIRARYSRGYDSRDVRYDRHDRYDRSFDRPAGPSELDQDFAAMKRVWQMIRAGAVRMVGEIGRQY